MYRYLEGILPLKRMLISAAIGAICLAIVLLSGLNSDYASSETVFSRAAEAFTLTSLLSFIVLMSAEEYGVYKSKSEIEKLIETVEIRNAGKEELEMTDKELQTQIDATKRKIKETMLTLNELMEELRYLNEALTLRNENVVGEDEQEEIWF